jgi:hypothetical protein
MKQREKPRQAGQGLPPQKSSISVLAGQLQGASVVI